MISIDQSKECQEVELSKSVEELEVLFATGIVNPNGPTFNVYYADTSSKTESSILYQVTIHPTSDSIQSTASIKWNSSGETMTGIDFYSDFYNSSLPTLFMKGNMLNKEVFYQIISMFIEQSEDSLRTYQYIKEYEGKPYQRVSAEMRGAIKSILGKTEEQKVGFFKKIFGKKNKEINEMDNPDLIKLLTKEKNILEEIKALLMAYSGSIENVIPSGMVQIDFKAFVNVFVHVAIQCGVDPSKINFK